MELRTLEYYLTVVQEENISRAAQVLHVTQPTLSRQMAELERELGVTLFERGKRLRLTEAGARLRDRAEEMVQLKGRIEQDMREGSELEGSVRVGTGGQANLSLLAQAAKEMHLRHPKVTFELYMNSSEHILHRMDRGLLDFGMLLEPIDVGKYDSLRLPGRDRWGLLVRRSHPLASLEFVTRQDLAGTPLLTTGRRELQSEIARWMGLDANDLTVVGTYNVLTNVIPVVAELDVAALAIEGVLSMIGSSDLAFLPLSPELSMTSVLAWRRGIVQYAPAQRYLEVLKSMYTVHTTT